MSRPDIPNMRHGRAETLPHRVGASLRHKALCTAIRRSHNRKSRLMLALLADEIFASSTFFLYGPRDPRSNRSDTSGRAQDALFTHYNGDMAVSCGSSASLPVQLKEDGVSYGLRRLWESSVGCGTPLSP